jgi:hypothetical protein
MSKVIDFPKPSQAEIINEAFFEKYADAALLLMSFEKMADAVDVIEGGNEICERDETHVGLVEACMALAVLFRRRTGFDVQQVSADHLEEQRRCLLAGEEIQLLPIPVMAPALSPLPPSAFNHLPDLELVQSGFGYISRVHEHIQSNAPPLIELYLARAHTLDAMNAFSLMIARLTGRSRPDKCSENAKTHAPGSETLQ